MDFFFKEQGMEHMTVRVANTHTTLSLAKGSFSPAETNAAYDRKLVCKSYCKNNTHEEGDLSGIRSVWQRKTAP